MIEKLIQETNELVESLENHEIYRSIDSKEKLQVFMQAHVFAVLDFMSLLNSLRRHFTPVDYLWTPKGNPQIRRFLNEIYLGEDTDIDDQGNFKSHFILYLDAMKEVGASSVPIDNFIKIATKHGVDKAFRQSGLPESALNFSSFNFTMIEKNNLPQIASSFCLGREKIIPKMFSSVLKKLRIEESSAPIFYYYIKRHIEIDGDSHGPMSEELLKSICGNDQELWTVAVDGAKSALEARARFWDELLLEINKCS